MSELFENQSINLETLPHVSYQDFKPIEPQFKILLHVRNNLFLIVLFSILIIFQFFGEINLSYLYFTIAYVFLFLLVIGSYILVELGFSRKAYLLRQHDLLYKTGYLIQKTTVIPKNRIQHIEIKQSLLLRLFRLSKLIIYTAGGSSSDLSISGLNIKDAELLKEHISLSISKYE